MEEKYNSFERAIAEELEALQNSGRHREERQLLTLTESDLDDYQNHANLDPKVDASRTHFTNRATAASMNGDEVKQQVHDAAANERMEFVTQAAKNLTAVLYSEPSSATGQPNVPSINS